MGPTIGPARNRKLVSQCSDQKKAPTVFGVRVARQPADMIESTTVIQYVKHGIGAVMVDCDLDVAGMVRVTNHIADEFAEYGFGVCASVGGESVHVLRFDEFTAYDVGSANDTDDGGFEAIGADVTDRARIRPSSRFAMAVDAIALGVDLPKIRELSRCNDRTFTLSRTTTHLTSS